MATTSILKCTAASYGYDNYGLSASSNLFVGKITNSKKGTMNYRTRIKFPSIKSLPEIGTNAIRITKVTLYVRGNGNTTSSVVVAGPSSDSAWGASRSGTGSATHNGGLTKFQPIVITADAAMQAIAGYDGVWYMHMTSNDQRVQYSGSGTGTYAPYLSIDWEFAQSTVTTDSSIVLDGETSTTFTINSSVYPEEETYSLAYTVDDTTYIVEENVQKTGDTTVIPSTGQWVPSVTLIDSITDSEQKQIEFVLTSKAN